MSNHLAKKSSEEASEFAVADKWLQRVLAWASVPALILAVIFNQTYLAIVCGLWLVVAIGYFFVKKLRGEPPPLELGIGAELNQEQPHRLNERPQSEALPIAPLEASGPEGATNEGEPNLVFKKPRVTRILKRSGRGLHEDEGGSVAAIVEVKNDADVPRPVASADVRAVISFKEVGSEHSRSVPDVSWLKEVSSYTRFREGDEWALIVAHLLEGKAYAIGVTSIHRGGTTFYKREYHELKGDEYRAEVQLFARRPRKMVGKREYKLLVRPSLQIEEVPSTDALKTKDGWLLRITDYQRRGLRKYVLVEKCDIDVSSLSNGKRYFEFTFHVRNYSMFYVSIPMAKYDPVKGTIRFNGDPISGEAKLADNKVIDLQPYGTNYFKVWQWVNQDEAKDIPKTLERVGNLFDFSEAVVYVRAEEFPDDEVAKLDLTSALRNVELENKVIQLEALHGQHALEVEGWRKYSDTIHSLGVVYGMALQASYTIEFPGDTPLPKNVLEYLRGHIDSTIHQCLGTAARDSYFEHVPPVPDGEEGQGYWIRSHCARLKALIEQQRQQLAPHQPTAQRL